MENGGDGTISGRAALHLLGSERVEVPVKRQTVGTSEALLRRGVVALGLGAERAGQPQVRTPGRDPGARVPRPRSSSTAETKIIFDSRYQDHLRQSRPRSSPAIKTKFNSTIKTETKIIALEPTTTTSPVDALS